MDLIGRFFCWFTGNGILYYRSAKDVRKDLTRKFGVGCRLSVFKINLEVLSWSHVREGYLGVMHLLKYRSVKMF